MNIEELITFATLKGAIELHEQIQQNKSFWRMRVRFGDKLITFVYHKDADDKLFFCNGRISTTEGKLGTVSSEIHGFKHLMKQL